MVQYRLICAVLPIIEPQIARFKVMSTRILLISSYDSFFATSTLLVEHFERQNAQVELAVVSIRPGQITTRQLHQAKDKEMLKSVKRVTFDQLADPVFLRQYDGYVLSADGPTCKRIFLRLAGCHFGSKKSDLVKRPAIMVLYPGLVFRFCYDGFAARGPADFIWLNCQKDLDDYQRLTDELSLPCNGRLFGVAPILNDIGQHVAPVQSKHETRRRKIVFFDQVVIPRSRVERELLALGLVRLARRYPEDELIIKPRTKLGERTIHAFSQRLHIANLVTKFSTSADRNISIRYESAQALLQEAHLCLTLSSTVAAEAIHKGVKTAIISDFGFNDDFGLHYFLGSGLTTSLADIDLDALPEVNEAWAAKYLGDPKNVIEALSDEYVALCRRSRNTGLPPFQITPWYGSESILNSLKESYTEDTIAVAWYRRPLKSLWIRTLSHLFVRSGNLGRWLR